MSLAEGGWGQRILKGIGLVVVFGILEYILGGLGLLKYVIEVPVMGWIGEKIGMWGVE